MATGTTGPLALPAPTDNTTTPIATLAILGDDSAATNTATEASTTDPLTITAGEGGGGETSAAANWHPTNNGGRWRE